MLDTQCTSNLAGNGRLDSNEFAAGFASELGASLEQAIKTFRALDYDESGDIDLTEILEMVQQMDKDGKE